MDENESQIQQQIEQRISELPLDVQNAILNSDFNNKIQSIGNSVQLHIDQLQDLSDITMLVMLGFMNENEYRKEVEKLAGNNPATAQKILDQVNNEIFLSIRGSMKEFYAKQIQPNDSIPSASDASAPIGTPALPATPPSTPPMLPEMHPADVLLTEKTVVAPPKPQESTSAPSLNSSSSPAQANEAAQKKAEPPKPTNYKADPYREPIN